MEHIVPAVVIILANLTSGNHGSKNYELWSAIFGYTAAISMVLATFSNLGYEALAPFLYQVAGFSLITVLSRDYEKILKPFFKKFEEKE